MDANTNLAQVYKATVAAEFEAKLPSGCTFKLRQPDAKRVMARFEMLPETLRTIMANAAKGEANSEALEASAEAHSADLVDMIRAFVCDCCIEPVVVATFEEETLDNLYVKRIPLADLMALSDAIFSRTGLTAHQVAKLAPFRQSADDLVVEPQAGDNTGGAAE